jgi:four helix bundle protein
MKYEEWERTIPEAIRTDALWKKAAYRCALFLAELFWHDVSALIVDARTRPLSGPLYEAVGSIGANLAEAYSRQSQKDSARFFEYTLGSVRESRHWYYGSRHVFGSEIFDHRMNLIGLIVRLCSPATKPASRLTLGEESPVYHVNALEAAGLDLAAIGWLTKVPMPREVNERLAASESAGG